MFDPYNTPEVQINTESFDYSSSSFSSDRLIKAQPPDLWTYQAIERSVQFHKDILQAVVNGDVERAQALLREHIIPTW